MGTELPDLDPEALLPGGSTAMRELRAQLCKVAPTDLIVLVIGEGGVGKAAVARAVHALSPRRDRAFIAAHCGAIAPSLAGCFERARDGTLFLGEITEMPPEMQATFVRVLEDKTFADVRVIASTHADVDAAVTNGRFRRDLMYRLAVFPLHVPPLRMRGDDVAMLAQRFLDELNRREGARKTFSHHALQQLASYGWPGNLRELKNVVSRAFILADRTIDTPFARGMRPRAMPTRGDGCVQICVGTPLAAAQRELIEATLDHFQGDKRRAAHALGVSLKTLYNRLEIYRGSAH